MASALFYLGPQAILAPVGLPAGAASATFYLTGTTTLAPIYADSALTTPLQNPLPADAFGRLPPVYMPVGTTYRIRLEDAHGAQLYPDVDPYTPGTYAVEADVIAAILAGAVAFNLPDEANGDAIPAAGSKLPYLSGGVLKIA